VNGAGSSSSSSSSSTARNSVTNRLRERRDAKDFMKPQFDHVLLRVVSMLSKLVNRYSEDLHLKEEAADYGRDEQAPA